ncbi:MAG: hypothetical protein LKF36_01920 [Lactobacillus sp.]|jgi:hypothetical protein|nr:hypothetical protein [Lactobacillus sp.]
MHTLYILFLLLLLINSISLFFTTRLKKDERGQAILYKTAYFQENFTETALLAIVVIFFLFSPISALSLLIIIIAALLATVLLKLGMLIYLDKKY